MFRLYSCINLNVICNFIILFQAYFFQFSTGYHSSGCQYSQILRNCACGFFVISSNHFYFDSGVNTIINRFFRVFFRRVNQPEQSGKYQIVFTLCFILNFVGKADYSKRIVTHFINFFNYHFLDFSIKDFNSSIIINVFAFI